MKYYPKIETPIDSFIGDSEDVLAWNFSTDSGKPASKGAPDGNGYTEVEWTYKGGPDESGYTEVEWTYKGEPEGNGYTEVECTYQPMEKQLDATSPFMADDFF